MNIAARIGDILLASGTSNADTRAQIHTVTSSYGLHYCHIDITMNTINMHTSIGTTQKTPVSVLRVVKTLGLDFSKLSEVDRLIRSIRSGATRPEHAEKILNEIYLSPPPYGRLMSYLGWGLLGGAVAILFGGDLWMALLGAITGMLIMIINDWFGHHDLPYFFQCVLGGLLATVPAAITYRIAGSIGFSFSPSLVIASGIVVLLAGLTLVQSLQDGMTGAPVTASARFFQTMLHTGGIVAGVATGIQLGDVIGFGLPPLETLAPVPTFSSAVARIVAGTLATIGFAIASYAEWGAVWVSGATAVIGSVAFYLMLLPMGASSVLASAVCATMIGLGGGLLARRFLIPPLITAVAGVTPLLPGLTVYRGMYAVLNDQMVVGLTNLGIAVATALALAAGVTLGEWIARRIRRPQVIKPYTAFLHAGRITFQQIRRAERAARTQRAQLAQRSGQKGRRGQKPRPH
ncbi:threonine/serine exporter family protein [Corynebacterium breve]|uniref:Threonine/serine exporter family protein n=2 Tax=Corynebacterium breve TaxID=3049799 RepID=A0ABY8VNB8_9CORY|nr:threonine/serine exporter family protein [Corynebacterium breve]WIM69065.1 threonine/serine exporter family protein [Corynebacterium breve]